jgi:hypothetical protein
VSPVAAGPARRGSLPYARTARGAKTAISGSDQASAPAPGPADLDAAFERTLTRVLDSFAG